MNNKIKIENDEIVFDINHDLIRERAEDISENIAKAEDILFLKYLTLDALKIMKTKIDTEIEQREINGKEDS